MRQYPHEALLTAYRVAGFYFSGGPGAQVYGWDWNLALDLNEPVFSDTNGMVGWLGLAGRASLLRRV